MTVNRGFLSQFFSITGLTGLFAEAKPIMSYRWFKEWADKTPKTIILIETREGFESFGTCATIIFRLTGAPMFRPNKKEKTKEPEVLIPMRDYPTLLDKMNRCQISYLVAREDFKVYSKEFDQRFYDIYTAAIKNPEKASEEDRMDRGLSVDDRVTVKNLETRKECCWKLVPEAEADVSRREKSGNLSIESVVGNALLGHRVGEDLTIVRGMNDTASYRILFALDPDNRKLKKIKRETKASKAELAEEAAEEEEARKHLADIAAFAETEEESDMDFLNPEPSVGDAGAPVTHLKTQNAHVSSALMSDEGPVMVFKEKTPEELAAEQAERDRIAAEEAAAAEQLAAEQAALAEEQPAEFAGAPAFADEQPIEFAEAPAFADEQPMEFAEAPAFADEQPMEFAEAPAFADEQPIEFAEAPAFADEQPIEFAEAPAFADEQPIEFAETPAFADEQPIEFAEAPAFADEQPVEFIDPIAVSDKMPASVAEAVEFAQDAPVAFADEAPLSSEQAAELLNSLGDGIPAATSAIVPFATSLSEKFFGPKKAGKARHAAAKRLKSDLPKSAKHVKTRAMRKLEKLAARASHNKRNAVSQ